MGGENIARQLNVSQYECYPGLDESDEEDEMDQMAQSYDLHPGKVTKTVYLLEIYFYQLND
jgi:hypothetical protein